MTMDEKSFRDALSNVIRGAILLVVLTIIRALAWKLPGLDMRIGTLNVGGYVYLVISGVIIAVLLKMFAPLRALVGYYLAAAAKIGKIPGRDRYLAHVIPLSKTIVLFVYVLLIYKYFAPVLFIVNEAFLEIDGLYKAFGIAGVVLGLWCLVQMWLQASPLIDLFTGKLTETTAGATLQLVTAACPKCGKKNDTETKFCIECGASMAPPPPPAPATCAQCNAVVAAGTKFCGSCGAAIA